MRIFWMIFRKFFLVPKYFGFRDLLKVIKVSKVLFVDMHCIHLYISYWIKIEKLTILLL